VRSAYHYIVVAIDSNREHDWLRCHAGCVQMGAPDAPSLFPIADEGSSAISLDWVEAEAGRCLGRRWVWWGNGCHLDGIGEFADARLRRKRLSATRELWYRDRQLHDMYREMYHECHLKIMLVTLLAFLFLGGVEAGGTEPKLYHEGDLKALVGQQLAEPSYLIGKFVYLGLVQGKQLFSTYALSGDLITGSGSGTRVAFGKVLISVRFDNDFPQGLVVGKAIAPTEDEPLVLERVMAAPNDFLFVECRSKQ
jgi:hypothetical protein